MSAKNMIDENHPKFQEYLQKCETLKSSFMEQEAQILSTYPKWNGLDHPAEEEIYPIRKKFYRDLKKLQEEYAFLWESVENNATDLIKSA